uniref:Uncharacterized protein n=1 Tax=Knipowitschia caucasica TaxID=637954 RepID=A0AAV2LMS3_KNICA
MNFEVKQRGMIKILQLPSERQFSELFKRYNGSPSTQSQKPLVGERAREWLKPSTAACERLTAILLAPRFLKDVEKISPLYHTSYIEAFHSLIIRFSPKSVCFSFKGMMARLQISALHYNENATRTHARTAAEGDATIQAIIKANPEDLIGATVYTTEYPSVSSAKKMIDSGISKLIYFAKTIKCNNPDYFKESEEMLNQGSITVELYQPGKIDLK